MYVLVRTFVSILHKHACLLHNLVVMYVIRACHMLSDIFLGCFA